MFRARFLRLILVAGKTKAGVQSNTSDSMALLMVSRHMSAKSDRKEQLSLEMKNVLGETAYSRVIENLSNLGFTASERIQLMAEHPRLATYSADKMHHQMLVLGSLGFKTEECRAIVIAAPQILGLEDRMIKNNYRELILQLGNHHGRVAAVVSPRTLTDNPLTTGEKIDYCVMKMGLPKPVIASSRILQVDLAHMKLRHAFAHRAGLYKTIHPKNQEGLPENPHINDLFFSTDENFLHLFNGALSLEDYVIFEALTASERETEEEEFGGDEGESRENEWISRAANYKRKNPQR